MLAVRRLYCLSLLLTGLMAGQADEPPAAGVERRLAQNRRDWIAQPVYNLKAVIPAGRDGEIQAELDLDFTARSTGSDLILDFTPGGQAISTLALNQKPVPWRFVNEHIVIAARYLVQGRNRLYCQFRLGDMSLNRRDDLIYSLFVPDRARTAFPCFDQPDLKGRFAVELEVPAGWQALANGPQLSDRELPSGRHLIRFSPSQPIPTYLMAFVAGELQRVKESRDGRVVQIFHQEKDRTVLDRNIPAIFDQVFAALAWMERYSGIAYPFDKYDLVIVPSFQYGGMEHCGATLYRSARLLLDENATLDQRLARANLIAHETAHMWFGDLVTMPWFDEVWLKEVFAGFMADKMVEELFPDIDHRLNFIMNHTAQALSVDRSAGSHPITQRLDNLAEAGTLYGHLIYHKAPIVMDQLEKRVGVQPLRQALGVYLKEHAYGNAGWDSLIDLLAAVDPGLKSWSRNWVYQAGLPTVTVTRMPDGVLVRHHDGSGQGRSWSQHLDLLVQKGEQARLFDLSLENGSRIVALPPELRDPDIIVPAGGGTGYGRILLDMHSYARLLSEPMLPRIPLWRGSAWFALNEGLLEGYIRAETLLLTALSWIETENDALVLERLLADLPDLFWSLPDERRKQLTQDCEQRLWRQMLLVSPERRPAFLDAFRRLACSPQAVDQLKQLLSGAIRVAGISLSEQKQFDILLDLVVHTPSGLQDLLHELPKNWQSNDRVRQLAFLEPLFSREPDHWLDFFRQTLSRAENREREPWVVKALALIHHPLRNQATRVLIPETLAILPEIQRTGDIFMPMDWLNGSLANRRSQQAAAMVRSFLDRDTSLSEALRLKVLQAADPLLRANDLSRTRIREWVKGLSGLPQARNAGNPAMLQRAADIIEKQWHEMGWKVGKQKLIYPEGVTWNLSVLWGDVNAPRLVIGAHYDVCGDSPGADDNASGLAVLLDLSARLRKCAPQAGRAVELVAYSLEEPPYFASQVMGSYIHADRLRKEKRNVALMISVDMVGYYADADSFLAVIGRETDKALLFKTAAVLAGETILSTRTLPLPGQQKGIDWSDHRNYWAQGYPALLLHSCPFFQNPHYHRSGDRPDILDYSRLSALSRALLALITAWPF